MPSLLDILQMAGQEAGRVGQGVLSAAALPGDVYSGKTQVNDESGNPTPDVMGRALSLASLASLDGMRFEPAPQGPAVALQRMNRPVEGIAPSAVDHNYRMLIDGRNQGHLSLNTESPDDLRVNFIENYGGGGETSLGPRTIRALMGRIAAQYPEARTISGYRVGGARASVDGRYDPARNVSANLPPPAAPPAAPAEPEMSLGDLLARATAANAAQPQPVPAGWQVY
jgi:hypothetical protein